MENNYPTLDQENIDVIATYMDDEIREELHSALAPCHPGVFLTAYCERDPSMLEIIDQEFRDIKKMTSEKIYMNLATGSVDTKDGWDYENEAGETVNAVDLGEAVEVERNEEGDWAEVK